MSDAATGGDSDENAHQEAEGDWFIHVLVALVTAAPVSFLLMGVLLVVDWSSGTEEPLAAEVTDTRTSRRAAGNGSAKTRYMIEGVDELGDTFEITVGRSTWRAASIGQTVEITRSRLSGSVREVQARGWDHQAGGPWLAALAGAMGIAGLAAWFWYVLRKLWASGNSADRKRMALLNPVVSLIATAGGALIFFR